MQLLFTRSTKLGSRLIRGLLGEPVSHVACRHGDVVMHSTFGSGVHLEWYPNWSRTVEIVYTLDIDGVPETYIAEVLAEHCGSPYDRRAFAYFAWRLLLWRWFNILPSHNNRWQVSNKFLCSGLASLMVRGHSNDMISPYQLYKELVASTVR